MVATNDALGIEPKEYDTLIKAFKSLGLADQAKILLTVFLAKGILSVKQVIGILDAVN